MFIKRANKNVVVHNKGLALSILKDLQQKMVPDKANTVKIKEKLARIKYLRSKLLENKGRFKDKLLTNSYQYVLEISGIAISGSNDAKLINRYYMLCVIAVTDTIQQLKYNVKKTYCLFPILKDSRLKLQPSDGKLKISTADKFLKDLFETFSSEKYMSYYKNYFKDYCLDRFKYCGFDDFYRVLWHCCGSKQCELQNFIIVGCYFPENFKFHNCELKEFIDYLKPKYIKSDIGKRCIITEPFYIASNKIIDFTIIDNIGRKQEIYYTRNRHDKDDSLKIVDNYVKRNGQHLSATTPGVKSLYNIVTGMQKVKLSHCLSTH